MQGTNNVVYLGSPKNAWALILCTLLSFHIFGACYMYYADIAFFPLHLRVYMSFSGFLRLRTYY